MASDIRIAIIDGTGPWFDSTYAKAMAPSFCHQVAQKLGGAAYYQRGPSFDGMSDAWKMDDATNWLKRQRQINPTVPPHAGGVQPWRDGGDRRRRATR